jgi:acetoacetate decarboxylase
MSLHQPLRAPAPKPATMYFWITKNTPSTGVDLKGAWTGPAELTLFSHALAPLAELPVLEIVSGVHILADLTLDLGKVVHDYLA